MLKAVVIRGHSGNKMKSTKAVEYQESLSWDIQMSRLAEALAEALVELNLRI